MVKIYWLPLSRQVIELTTRLRGAHLAVNQCLKRVFHGAAPTDVGALLVARWVCIGAKTSRLPGCVGKVPQIADKKTRPGNRGGSASAEC